QLERIQSLKTSYKVDTLNLYKIIRLEQDVINKKHYSDFLKFSFPTHKENSIPNEIKKIQNNFKTIESQNSNSLKVSSLWMVISSTYSLLLIFPFLILLPVNQEFDKNAIFGWFSLIVILAALITSITVIAYQIPIINENPFYNYLLNAGIHLVFIILFIIIIRKNR
ncbi:hypothetical protein, partial [Xanthovirga aplysinae]|uniref:hypothetical protein n=1 Tax=Xanthovirga aplysinae TaxID=2529853 RepID=UPI001CA42CB0